MGQKPYNSDENGVSSEAAALSHGGSGACRSLLLLMDSSSSMEVNWYNQYAHTADAITDPDVLSAMFSGGGWLAVKAAQVFDRAEPLTDWRSVRTPEEAQKFAQELRDEGGMVYISNRNGTNLASGIRQGIADFEHSPCQSNTRVIDISSDGEDGAVLDTLEQRAHATSQGIRINGIAIGGDRISSQQAKELLEANIANGFVLEADWENYRETIERKLQWELSEVAPGEVPIPAETPAIKQAKNIQGVNRYE